MINFLDSLWKKARSKYCPKRIYKYGTAGLSYFDDRTYTEKLCDAIDEWFFKKRQYQRWEKSRSRRSIFHSFFDVSTGKTISSVAEIDAICKSKGLEYMSFREIDSEAARYRKINEQDAKRQIKKDMGGMLRDIKQGRSFVKEAHEKIRQGHYEIGQRQTYNG